MKGNDFNNTKKERKDLNVSFYSFTFPRFRNVFIIVKKAVRLNLSG